jgi:hypothetical protein
MLLTGAAGDPPARVGVHSRVHAQVAPPAGHPRLPFTRRSRVNGPGDHLTAFWSGASSLLGDVVCSDRESSQFGFSVSGGGGSTSK